MASASRSEGERTKQPAEGSGTAGESGTEPSAPEGLLWWVLGPLRRRMSAKIIAPYLLLVVAVAALAMYVVVNLVTGSLEEKYRSQLADSGRAVNETMVSLEAEQLAAFRQMAYTQGVAEALQSGDADRLEQLLEPLRANARLEYVEVLGANGGLTLALRGDGRADLTSPNVDPQARQWEPVAAVLAGQQDDLGDKYSALVPTPWGTVLYTVGPVKQGQQVVGAIAVGIPLERVLQRLSAESLSGITLYGPQGEVIASTLPGASGQIALPPTEAQRIGGLQGQIEQRGIALGASRYQEMLGTLEVRGKPVSLLGVSQSVSLIENRAAETRRQLILLFGAVVVLVLVLGWLLARLLTRPIKRLADACRALAAGDFNASVPVTTSDETGLLTRTFNQSVQGLRERDRARDAFGRYMSPELYEQIQRGEMELGGETRDITIVLSDIRGFTSLSETMEPRELVGLLNEYFENQVAAIQRYGGSVDKYMGDAILARFGAPVAYADHAVRAVLAMIEMSEALEQFNQKRERQGQPTIRNGVGANSGAVVVGNIGSSLRMEYTIIWDTVNATQRIAELCKSLDWDLLIGETTARQVTRYVQLGEPHRTVLRGRIGETRVFPVLGLKAAGELLVARYRHGATTDNQPAQAAPDVTSRTRA